MGKETLSRRQFFRRLKPKSQENTDDLFDQYARKTAGRKGFSEELAEVVEGRLPEESTVRVRPVTTGIAAYTGSWTVATAAHLLRRTGFGATKPDIDALAAMNVQSAVADILTPSPLPPAPVVAYLDTTGAYPDATGLAYGSDWTNTPLPTSATFQHGQERIRSLRARTMGNYLNASRSISEKMGLFWYHFIPVSWDAVSQYPLAGVYNNSGKILYEYYKLLRNGALGNFKTLIRQISTSPAMMFYLNNQSNSAAAPDENYARELMELFTLGKDPQVYTEQDVKEAAKVLSGWRISNVASGTMAPIFNISLHSTVTKQFSAAFGNTSLPNAGASEIDQLIDMIFSKQPQTVARYIVTRLYRFFVYYDIDDSVKNSFINPLAQLFINSNWEILPVLQAMFKSEHFYDMANRGVYIKTPYDIVVGTLRSLNVNTNVTNPAHHRAQYTAWYNLSNYTRPMGQEPWMIENVAGWPAFYQAPAYHENWINSYTIQRRMVTMDTVLSTNGINFGSIVGPPSNPAALSVMWTFDRIAYVQQFGNTVCADPNLLIDKLVQYLLPMDISAAQKAAMKLQTLLTGQTTDGYWTTAWNNYLSAPANTTYLTTVKNRLSSLFTYLLKLEEFQLM